MREAGEREGGGREDCERERGWGEEKSLLFKYTNNAQNINKKKRKETLFDV